MVDLHAMGREVLGSKLERRGKAEAREAKPRDRPMASRQLTPKAEAGDKADEDKVVAAVSAAVKAQAVRTALRLVPEQPSRTTEEMTPTS